MTTKPAPTHTLDLSAEQRDAPAKPARRAMLKASASTVALTAAGAQTSNAQVVVAQPAFITGGAYRPFQEVMPVTPILPEVPMVADATNKWGNNKKPAGDFVTTPSLDTTGTPYRRPSDILPGTQAQYPAFTDPATGKVHPAGLYREGRGDPHQYRTLTGQPQKWYVQRYGAVPAAKVHPQLPLQRNLWGANLGGADLTQDPPMSPTPTLVSDYDVPMYVRRYNHLPDGAPSGGFGKNSISMHLHNFHSGPDSDGGPCDPALGALAETPQTQGRFFFRGQFFDHYYSMRRSGFTTNTPAMLGKGAMNESLGTLWYHDHREAHTAENVYKGLAGFHIVFNQYDTGDENTGFRLPSFNRTNPALGYDIPIGVADLKLDATGQATMDLLNTDGHLGEYYIVNGKVQPFFTVKQRRYRFRLLDKGPSRFYQLFLTNPDNPTQAIPFWRIGNDGNLYEKPILTTNVKIGVAERADIIVDFADIVAKFSTPGKPCTRLWLENRLIQTDGRTPTASLDAPGIAKNVLVELRIDPNTVGVVDNSLPITANTSFAPITLPVHLISTPTNQPAVTRIFQFGRGAGGWVVNGKAIDCSTISWTMKRGRLERWIYRNGGGWSHPIHNHFVEGRIMRRNQTIIGPGHYEYCRKDVVALYPGDEVEYWVMATDYVGVYPMHCHNVVHEDAGMMMIFRVNDIGDTIAQP